MTTTNTDLYRTARDHLVASIGDYEKAVGTFAWPTLAGTFNWATDWFDVIAQDNDRTALWIVEQDGGEQRISFAAMADRSIASRPGCNGSASARVTAYSL